MKFNFKRISIAMVLILSIPLAYFTWVVLLEKVFTLPWSPSLQAFLDAPGPVMVTDGASFGGKVEDRPCNVHNTEMVAFKASKSTKNSIIYYCNKYYYNSIYYVYDILLDQRDEDYIIQSNVVPSGFEITSESELRSKFKHQDESKWKLWLGLALMIGVSFILNKKFSKKRPRS